MGLLTCTLAVCSALSSGEAGSLSLDPQDQFMVFVSTSYVINVLCLLFDALLSPLDDGVALFWAARAENRDPTTLMEAVTRGTVSSVCSFLKWKNL